MKRFVVISFMLLALLTMGLSDMLVHPLSARAWSGSFNSTPDSYSYVAYANMPTRASQTAQSYFGPYGVSWGGCTTSRTAQESNSTSKLVLGNLATIADGKSFGRI